MENKENKREMPGKKENEVIFASWCTKDWLEWFEN